MAEAKGTADSAGRRNRRVSGCPEMSQKRRGHCLRAFPVRRCRTGVGFIKNAGLVTGPNPLEFEASRPVPVFRLVG